MITLSVDDGINYSVLAVARRDRTGPTSEITLGAVRACLEAGRPVWVRRADLPEGVVPVKLVVSPHTPWLLWEHDNGALTPDAPRARAGQTWEGVSVEGGPEGRLLLTESYEHAGRRWWEGSLDGFRFQIAEEKLLAEWTLA